MVLPHYHHLSSPPLPPLPPSLYIPPPVDRRDDIPKSERPPRKSSCLFALGSRYKVGESSTTRPTEVEGDTWVDPAEAVPEIAPMTIREVNTRVTELVELHEHDTQDLYALLEDAQDSRTRISQRETVLIVEEEAYASREAWAHAIGLSQAVHYELQTHHEQVYAHESQLHAHQTQLARRIMAPVTRRGPNTPPNNTNPNNMTLESVQAMIDQALLRNSTNGDGSHSSHEDNRRNVQTTRPCFYAVFMKCQPSNFKGTEGIVYAYSMTWEVLKKKMTDKYCPQGEIKKLEIELWNLKVKGNDVPTYTERFQELTLICTKFVANETERRKSETGNKRKADDSSRNNHGHQQQPFKRQNVAKVYNMGAGEKKPYGGSLPKGSGNTNVANAQRDNRAVPKGNGCFECGAPGHFKRDCPKLKNKDRGNGNAQGWVYAVGNAEIIGMLEEPQGELHVCHDSRIDIAPTILENSYVIELADGKIVGIDTIV
ncbi:reverse transcriptase domain-containing protein [Tanacetum coccineum]